MCLKYLDCLNEKKIDYGVLIKLLVHQIDLLHFWYLWFYCVFVLICFANCSTFNVQDWMHLIYLEIPIHHY